MSTDIGSWRERSLVRKLHRWNAAALVVFLLFHVFNHLNFVGGPEQHISVMAQLRSVYRLLPVELAIFFLFFSQIVLGLVLARKNWRPTSAWSWAQVVSGLVIAFFLTQHLAAVLFVRSSFDTIDTNGWWALSVVSKLPVSAYFLPYYSAGLLAVFVHLASAAHYSRNNRARFLARPLIGLGAVVSVVVIGSMIFITFDRELPRDYQNYLGEMYSP